MKRTHKKIFGLFGLVLVAAMTVFAAFLPGPETQAADGNMGVTDTIKIRVVGSEVNVDMTGITPGSILTNPGQNITLSYENAKNLSLTVKFTDDEGNEYESYNILDNVAVNYCPGSASISIDLLTGAYSYSYERYDEYENTITTETGSGFLDNYGYGSYVITASDVGATGDSDEAHTAFTFTPVYGNVSQGKVDGKTVNYLNVYYNSIYNEGEVASVKVVVLDAAGNEVAFSPILIPASSADTSKIKLPFSEYGLPDGDYTIEIYGYGVDSDEPLAMPYILKVKYEADKIIVPDTGDVGGLFGGLNISKTDYLMTGLIVFLLAGIFGAVFIAKRDKKSSHRRR